MSSKRGYLTQEDLAQYADIVVTDTTEADDQISQAEEMIDGYVGPQDKFIPHVLNGKIAAGGNNNVTLDQLHQNVYQKNYLLNCIIEIVGGVGQGQSGKITGQTLAGVITVETAFSVALDATSFYKIYQLGKFPRCQDVYYDSTNTPNQYYKQITDAVKRATAAQLQYVIDMGMKFFSTDASQKSSERIGDYSYTKGGLSGQTAQDPLIAPKAKIYLKGIKNRKGTILT